MFPCQVTVLAATLCKHATLCINGRRWPCTCSASSICLPVTGPQCMHCSYLLSRPACCSIQPAAECLCLALQSSRPWPHHMMHAGQLLLYVPWPPPLFASCCDTDRPSSQSQPLWPAGQAVEHADRILLCHLQRTYCPRDSRGLLAQRQRSRVCLPGRHCARLRPCALPQLPHHDEPHAHAIPVPGTGSQRGGELRS